MKMQQRFLMAALAALTVLGGSATAAEPPAPGKRFALPRELQEKVNRAIDRGVVFLKKELEEYHARHLDITSDVGPYRDNMQVYEEGMVALMGLALLESGVPARDPVLQKTAAFLRARAGHMDRTYSLATALFFFDRLADRTDRPLIKTLALRLVLGQSQAGLWGYHCPPTTAEGETLLLAFLRSLKKDDPDSPAIREKLDDPRFAVRGNYNRVRYLAVVRGRLTLTQQQKAFTFSDRDDLSNTQFAVLALWVARRQELPLDPVLTLAIRAVRKNQHPSGSWDYLGDPSNWPSTSTCAGLLGLAVERGLEGADKAPPMDAAARKAFAYLGRTIGMKDQGRSKGGQIIRAYSWGDLYYFWSLERVAMVYDLETIEGKNWYAWAAKEIVAAQQRDGSWHDAFGGHIDTSFALLVLKRANLFEDLTRKIAPPRPAQREPIEGEIIKPTPPKTPLNKLEGKPEDRSP